MMMDWTTLSRRYREYIDAGNILLASCLLFSTARLAPTSEADRLLEEFLLQYSSAREIYADTAAKSTDVFELLVGIGDFSEVVELAASVTGDEPRDAKWWSLLGGAYVGLGQGGKAKSAMLQSLHYPPRLPLLHYNLGRVCLGLGELDDAIQQFKTSVLLDPHYTKGFTGLADAFIAKGDFSAAEGALSKAFILNTSDWSILYKYAYVCSRNKNFEKAILLYSYCDALRPDHAELLYNCGNAYKSIRNHTKAIDCFQRSLSVNPNLLACRTNLANTYQITRQLDLAEREYRKVLDADPNDFNACLNLANTVRDQLNYPAAAELYAHANAINPESPHVKPMLLSQFQHMCDWDGADKSFNQIQSSIEDYLCPPFILLRAVDDPALHRQASEWWVKNVYDVDEKEPPLDFSRRAPDRIKIGYFGADFYDHATMFLMAGLLRSHNKEKFEIHIFNYGAVRPGKYRAIARDFSHGFYDVENWSDQDIIFVAREQGLHVAIDLKGYTQGANLGIFARRLAPLQISYLGYPGTSGAAFIDYLIADKTVIPDSEREHYSERIIFMPDTYQPTDNLRKIYSPLKSRSDYGLPEDAFVYASFNNNYKIGRNEFEVWCQILHDVPHGVLWIFCTNDVARKNLLARAQGMGIAVERIFFMERVPTSEHLARHAHANLVLDTFNYNSHTTCSEALWQGVPVLTLPGRQFSSRVAASLLYAIDCPRLVAVDISEFLSTAVQLGVDKNFYNSIRDEIQKNRSTTPLFDTARYTQSFERGIESAYFSFLKNEMADIFL